jgi:hypothetical protein
VSHFGILNHQVPFDLLSSVTNVATSWGHALRTATACLRVEIWHTIIRYQEEYHKRLGDRHPLDKSGDRKPQSKDTEGTTFKYLGCYGSEEALSSDKVCRTCVVPACKMGSSARWAVLTFTLVAQLLDGVWCGRHR